MPLSLPKILEPLLRRPVAVFGGGVSGRAVADLVGTLGGSALVYDEKAGAGQRNAFTAADAAGHGLVVFSPGFRVEHPWLVTAAGAGCVCLGELDFASLFWKGRIVAITGTNGKTTLTEFLTQAFAQAGLKAQATGNIGHSFTKLVAEQQGGDAAQVAVCEVSSFQSETLAHFEAEAVLWSNFAEDHLERHPGLAAYFSAKNQLLLQSPRAAIVAGSSVGRFAAKLGYLLPVGSLLETEGQAAEPALEGTVFADYPQRENFILARELWRRLGLKEADLFAAAKAFRLGKHRLGAVATVGGVTYWNDSKATNFHAVEAALSRFTAPVLLILGGKAKGGDIAGFVARIAPRVKHALLIGVTREELASACRAAQVSFSVCQSLEDAVGTAAAKASPGDHVLLSPAFASFDMFNGYDHRGEVFETLVRQLPAASAGKH